VTRTLWIAPAATAIVPVSISALTAVSGQLESLADETGTQLRRGSRAAVARHGVRPALHFDGAGNVRVSAGFTNVSGSSQVGVVLGLTPSAEQSKHGVACVVSSDGHLRLLVRSGAPDASDTPCVTLPGEVLDGVRTMHAMKVTMSTIGARLSSSVNGQVFATLSRDGSEIGVPGVWTARTGDAAVAALQFEVAAQ
jgi:hypothetical protein